ncbi:hypothetical protein BpHYR1_041434 [Brachionus plicatilis]|uniref:Uncharacterized protein n=1 Tax=Brachionus plicatilis TaxID=10195 RepID=A0A3M7PVN0_BRAPC|nr:hypothetical protein BpHYR1_041434 [Brachionus plicatilis]
MSSSSSLSPLFIMFRIRFIEAKELFAMVGDVLFIRLLLGPAVDAGLVGKNIFSGQEGLVCCVESSNRSAIIADQSVCE